MSEIPHLLPAAALRRAVERVVAGFGSSAAEVQAVAANLVDANLCGHDSHGIGMLPRYADAWLEGGLVANAHATVTADAGTLLRLDGCAGFGQVIGHEAMAMGIERAGRQGSCIVALGNAHHLGRIGAWAEQCAAAGLVSVHFVNVISRPIVAPHGGADARFGTNPFCAGVPLRGRPPVILDFATSVIAQGKTRVAHHKGEWLAPGCLLDDLGRPTLEPRYTVVPPWGALLAFGGHKGYGLALLCELLGGALAAGRTLHDADAGRRRVLNGMLSVLVDPAALGEASSFEQQALAFLEWVRQSPPRDGAGPVQVAGDAERGMRARRQTEGVPVDPTTWREILEAAARVKVDPAAVNADVGLG